MVSPAPTVSTFAPNLHATLARLDVIDLFQVCVVVGWNVLPWLEGLLGKTRAAQP